MSRIGRRAQAPLGAESEAFPEAQGLPPAVTPDPSGWDGVLQRRAFFASSTAHPLSLPQPLRADAQRGPWASRAGEVGPGFTSGSRLEAPRPPPAVCVPVRRAHARRGNGKTPFERPPPRAAALLLRPISAAILHAHALYPPPSQRGTPNHRVRGDGSSGVAVRAALGLRTSSKRQTRLSCLRRRWPALRCSFTIPSRLAGLHCRKRGSHIFWKPAGGGEEAARAPAPAGQPTAAEWEQQEMRPRQRLHSSAYACAITTPSSSRVDAIRTVTKRSGGRTSLAF